MKDTRPQKAYLTSNADFKSRATSVVTGSVPSLLRQVGATSMRSIPTDRMQQASVFNLCQQILQISSTRSGLEVLTEIAAIVAEAFQADGCAISLPETFQLGASTAYWLSGFQPLLQPHRLPPETFHTWATQTISIDHIDPAIDVVEATPDSDRERLAEVWRSAELPGVPRLQARSMMGTLTEFQGATNGLISLMQLNPYRWTEPEIEGFQAVSRQVASAIAQLQLQRQSSKQIQYQAVINKLTLSIRSSSDLNESLKLATEDTAKALQVDRGMLLRLKYWDPLFRRAQEQIPKIRVSVAYEWLNRSESSEQNDLRQTHSNEPPSFSSEGASFWMSECPLCQQAFIQSANPILVANPQQLPKGEPGVGIASIFNLGAMSALLLAPLESQGTVLGFLVFQHRHDRVWQPDEVELVKLVSAQVSTAIIQTETLRQVQGLVEKRTAELRESLSVQAKLYERTRNQLDQLRHLNQVKDEFLNTVSHELRTPLTSMTMAIRMLRQTGLSSDRSDRYLDILEQQCTQETNLINDLLALQELESKQMPIQLQEINLKEMIQALATAFNQKWAAKGVTLAVNLPQRALKLQSDRDSLNRILIELLTNAGKYSDPNTTVQLTIAQQVEQSGNKVVLTLQNSGAGIAPEELPYIFDKFRRCQGATQNAIQGTGLGLALVKSLTQHINGEITAFSCPTDHTQVCETSFTLVLPQLFSSKL